MSTSIVVEGGSIVVDDLKECVGQNVVGTLTNIHVIQHPTTRGGGNIAHCHSTQPHVQFNMASYAFHLRQQYPWNIAEINRRFPENAQHTIHTLTEAKNISRPAELFYVHNNTICRF
jgi:hypothetical protein